MKNDFHKFDKGSSTIEIMIAFTVLILSMSAVVMVIWSNNSVFIDTQTNNEAIFKTSRILENIRSTSRQNYLGIVSYNTSETSGNINYIETITVSDLTQCKKQVNILTSWQLSPLRNQKIELSTTLTDFKTALALGGDCINNPPLSNWNNPTRFASDTISPGKPTALDELNKIIYLGADKSPFLYIANTTGAVLGQNSGLFVSFANSFDLGFTINSLDAVRYSVLEKNYVFAAVESSNKQLFVVDVTDILNPEIKKQVGLSACVTGSEPQGNLVYYYKDKLYLTTKYTAGPEFHIFDVSDPLNPIEFGAGGCKGFELGNTVNDFIVLDQIIGGLTKRYIYMATDESDKELRVFDVTNSNSIIEVNIANQNLVGIQNGLSVFAVGNKLYFGRQSTPSGPDLYIFDISNPALGLTLLGSKDINTGVSAIRVAGKFAFISTPKANQEFQVWNIFDPGNINNIAIYNFGNIVNRGIDFNPDFIYATGQSTPNLQIIYSP